MASFKKFVENYEPVNEAEYNKEWWDSKSDSFKKRYIERHPNSIYAKQARTSANKSIASKDKSIDRAKARMDRFNNKASSMTKQIQDLKKEYNKTKDDKQRAKIERAINTLKSKQQGLYDKANTADKKAGSLYKEKRKAANDVLTQTKVDTYIQDELEDVDDVYGPNEAGELRKAIYHGKHGLSPFEYVRLSQKAARYGMFDDFLEVILGNDTRRFDDYIADLNRKAAK